MKATKIQTTVLTRNGDIELSQQEKRNLIERLNLEARRFMLERGFFAPGCVVTLEDERPEVLDLAAGLAALASDDLDNLPPGAPGKTQSVLRTKAQTLVAVPCEAIR